MTELLLIAVFILMGVFGYRIMDHLDRFLEEHVTGEEEPDEQHDPTA